MAGKFIRVHGRVVPVKGKGASPSKKPPKPAVNAQKRQKKIAAPKAMSFASPKAEGIKGKHAVFSKALGIVSVGYKK